MAYNPFDFFRRNQKIMFSGLTIVIMFMFVFSFGQNDFFSWFPRWLGGKKSRGEVLAVIDGDKFRESEVSQIRLRRGQANQYMTNAAEKARANLLTYSKDNASKVSAEYRSAVTGVVENYQFGSMLDRLPQQQQQQFLQQNQNLYLSYFTYKTSLRKLDGLFRNANAAPDDLDVANAVRKYMLLTEMSSLPERQYFLNQPNRSAKDAIEYTLWLKKADQLKIHFRTADVDALIEQEFLQLKGDEREKILQDMVVAGRDAGLTKDRVLDAIGDEFRVRLAQSAVLGLPDVRGTARSGRSPFDFYEYYRSETSPVQYGMITVPVENYIAKVEGQPTETELRELFSKAKNSEADPAEPKIGIKKGRELKLAWLEITGKEPFYAAAAADALVKAEVAAKMSGLLAVPFGPGAMGNVLSAGMLKVEDPALQAAYDNYRSNHAEDLASIWFGVQSRSFRRSAPALDTGFAHPQVVAATVGLAAMPLGTAANRFSVANGTLVSAEGTERRQRLFAGLAMLAAPNLGGTAVLAQVVGNGAATNSGLPSALPIAAVKAKLVVETRDSLRFNIAQGDLQKFQEELAKINKDPDAEKASRDAAAYIAKFTNPASNWIDADGKTQLGRGLLMGGSTGFFDVHTIGDDPGLATLKKRLEGPHSGQVTAFGRRFFSEEDRNTGQPRIANSLFAPFTYPEPNNRFDPLPDERRSQLLVWRTAEVPAEAAKDFDKARPKLVEIWKRQKARELAKKAADDLAAKAGNLGTDTPTLDLKYNELLAGYRATLSPAEADRAKAFELNNVAGIVVSEGGGMSGIPGMPGMPGGVTGKPYSLGPTPEIPYPTQKMVEALVSNRTKPISTAFVMADRPENQFYVGVLIQRVVSNESKFVSRVYSPDPSAGQANSLADDITGMFESEARKQAREEAVELLKAEFVYEKETEHKDKLTGTAD